MNKRMMKYNPAFLTEDELIAGFVVREREMRETVEVFRGNDGDSNQHVLVVGPRGSGKTMFVLRIAAAINRDPELSEKLYTIPFAEESYNVGTPGEFWLEAIYRLPVLTGDPRWKDLHEELLDERDDERLRQRALAHLMDFADEQDKRLVLIVENLNMLLGEQISDKDAWTLRHTLINEPRIMLLASATSQRNIFLNAEKAMFELFRAVELRALDQEDSKTLWSSITGVEIETQKIRPIQILTGGSPRLISIIASFCTDLCFNDLMEQMFRLVDDHTDYFKSHLESLATKERKIYLALAEIWNPATASEVARIARESVNQASSYLQRLVEKGLVVEVAKRGKAKYYQISERLYNIYYLMRRSGMPQRRVKAMIDFIIVFYRQTKWESKFKSMDQEATNRFLDDVKTVKNNSEDAITLGLEFAAAGGTREALEAIEQSPSADLLEPLIVGLKLDLGEEVLAPAEILEIARDVKERIDQHRAHRAEQRRQMEEEKSNEDEVE